MINKIAANAINGMQTGLPSISGATDTDFSDTLNQAINQINELQKESVNATEMFVRGVVTDLHQVMMATEKARLGMELMLEVRNRLFEGYQEIMRMQM